MARVKITALINKNQDHCKYGVDLYHFLKKVQDLKNLGDAPTEYGAESIAYADMVSLLKVDPILKALETEITPTDGKSQYMITVDDVDRDPVIDNQIWMHELPQELVELLQA